MIYFKEQLIILMLLAAMILGGGYLVYVAVGSFEQAMQIDDTNQCTDGEMCPIP